MTFTIIVTGYRDYPISKITLVNTSLRRYLDEYFRDIFVKVGDCPTGADLYTRNWCRENLRIDQWKEFPANWVMFGKGAGPRRNRQMVDSGADRCLAFPDDVSVGTEGCAKYAYKKGIPVEFPELPQWAQWAIPIASFKSL